MKKFLLFAAVALVVSTAGAQMKSKTECIAEGVNTGAVLQTKSKASPSQTVTRKALGPVSQHQQLHPLKLSEVSTIQEMKMRDPASRLTSAPKAPSRDEGLVPFYRRPAGMFSSSLCFMREYGGVYFYDGLLLMAKPYAEYYWSGFAENANQSTSYGWTTYPASNDTDEQPRYIDYQSGLYRSVSDFNWLIVPLFTAYDGRIDDSGVAFDSYQLCNYKFSTDDEGATIANPVSATVYAVENGSDFNYLYDGSGDEFQTLCSSKTFLKGGRYGDTNSGYYLTFYYGADPYGDNEQGWWLGKNASHVDGIAQAFEKPQYPYILNHVYLMAAEMAIREDVMMTCKVYRLNEIPAFGNESVTLPDAPGELIALGHAYVTPASIGDDDTVLEFTLSDFTGAEIHPVIDYPILVAVEGYNDSNMEDLIDFTALCSYNDKDDEGYGELAYIKVEKREYDENDEPVYLGEYEWKGINNFWANVSTMKVGLSIFIDINNPYITFNEVQEDGQYLFPATGGLLSKTWLDGTSTSGIRFLTHSSADDKNWRITCDGSESLPSWLDINLIDGGNSSSHGEIVIAQVMAAPLPSGMSYREAVVKFEIPGAYIDYKFMQGTPPVGLRGDVDQDGLIGISDVSALIDFLLNDISAAGPQADVDADGEVGISDVSELTDYLLGNADLTPMFTGNRDFTVNGVSFKMIAVEGGTVAIGGTRSQEGNIYVSVENPVHTVTLSDYYIGQTEVTQALWQAVMGTNPSNFTGDLRRPVEMVSWIECQQFITKLNQMTGMNFRMLTEAEWEFAARGGIKTRGFRFAGSSIIDEVAWYNANAGGTTHPVGSKAPNELGIYDMSGNVYEYCYDWFTGYGYPSSDNQINPTGPETGDNRVIRGGSIDYGDDNCRAARRWGDSPDGKWKDQGLRLAL